MKMAANDTNSTDETVPAYLQSDYVVGWANSHAMDAVNFGILIACTVVFALLLVALIIAIFQTSRKVLRPIILSQLSFSYLMFFIALLVGLNQAALSATACNNMANLMIFSVLATTIWSTLDPFSIYISGAKIGPRFKYIYYTIIGWGAPLLLMIIFVVANSVQAVPLYHPDRCMVDLEKNLYSMIIPVGAILLANIVAIIVMMKKSKEKEYLAFSVQLQIKSCRLMFIVLTIPMYIAIGVIFSIYSLSNYPLYLEYIATALYILITLLAVVTMLMIDPTVKNSLLQGAKDQYQMIKVQPKETKLTTVYIP